MNHRQHDALKAILRGCLVLLLLAPAGSAAAPPDTRIESQIQALCDILSKAAYHGEAYKLAQPPQTVSISGQAAISVVIVHREPPPSPNLPNLPASNSDGGLPNQSVDDLSPQRRDPPRYQFWALPLPCPKPAMIKPLLTSEKTRDGAGQWEVFYLGQGDGFAWFCYLPLPLFAEVQRKLDWNGDSRIPILLRGMALDPDSCAWQFLHEADQHLPEIQQAVARKTPGYGKIIESVGWRRQPVVTAWLRELVASPDKNAASSARAAMIQMPRAEVADLYVTWLEQGLGKYDVCHTLEACQAVKAGGALPLLPRIFAAPPSAKAYRLAAEMENELDKFRDPMPSYLLDAETIILGRAGHHRSTAEAFDEARDRIATSSDTREAAIIGVQLTLEQGKIDADDLTAIRNAGITILRRLPNGEGPRLLRLLIANDKTFDHFEAERLKVILAAVEAP